MRRGIFITGTDTEVGKTHVACLLAGELGRNFRVGVMKPAESGCARVQGRAFPRDAALLKEASRCDWPIERICPHAFFGALAPAEAARREGRSIDLSLIRRTCKEMQAAHDIVLVEGAGGLLAPIWGAHTCADLAKDLNLPLLIVARAGLGTLNHSLLTLEVAQTRNIAVLAVVLNQSQKMEEDESVKTNAQILRQHTKVPVLGPLPHVSPVEGALGGISKRIVDDLVQAVLFREHCIKE